MYKGVDVAVLGTCNLDFISRVSRFAGADEEVNMDHLHQSVGGSAANAALTLSEMGIKTGIMTRVGEDYGGNLIRQALDDAGIGTERIISLDKPTGMTFIAVDDQGERSIYVHMGANAHFQLIDEDRAYIEDAKVLHLTGMYLEVVEEASQHAKILSFNPGMLLSSFGLPELKNTLMRADILFLNQKEAGILTGLEPSAGAEYLVEMGVPRVILTKGREGATLYTPDEIIVSPAVESKVTDTTGAGDTFAAAFLASHLQGKDGRDCLNEANLVASRQVRKWGGF
ncbi:carbohydrate kinase family protein [Methanobacterium sp. CWC-01]|jgi:ribokinase|uniref:carbohydrate kinase family protein n=1 Tax=Methanobacterium aridiramus TaxID=2584467 RepID=UPI002577773A|nr:carbohydrate kinase family protein [Methanobacterium sp. CWC-01]WJI10082.1 carbohydrate kinase family protein [Methanobacterium sp. CWC-01]